MPWKTQKQITFLTCTSGTLSVNWTPNLRRKLTSDFFICLAIQLQSADQIHINPSLLTPTNMDGTVYFMVLATAHGHFLPSKPLLSINTKETLPIQYSYMSFKEYLCNSHVYLLSNNTTNISYIKSIAGVTSWLNSNIVKDLWNTAVQYNIWFTITYLTRKLNKERYIASCFLNDGTEWEVSPSMFCCITDHH